MPTALTPTIGSKFHHSGNYTGNSDVIAFTSNILRMTASVSSVSGGSVTMQYSLGSASEERGNTLVWHNTQLMNKTTSSALEFLTPVTYLRVIASNDVSYRLEVVGI